MSGKRQLECRIVIIHHRPNKLRFTTDQEFRSVELGMYDPYNMRYEFLGRHHPDKLDEAVYGLKTAIERAGHRLSFCERSEW